MFLRVPIQPVHQRFDLFLRVGRRARCFVAHADKQRDAQLRQSIGRGYRPLAVGENHVFVLAAGGEALQFEDLRAPALAEKPARPGRRRFRGRRVHEDLLIGAIRVHQMHDGDGKSAVSAAETERHGIVLRKPEIAMDMAHHIHKNGVGGITAVHGAPDFGAGERSQIVALVVSFAVGLFQPAIEGETIAAPVKLVFHHVGDRADAEKRIGRARRRAVAGGLQRCIALRDKIVHSDLLLLWLREGWIKNITEGVEDYKERV